LNIRNSNHLFKIINGSSFFSESPKEDCEDILQETHLKMLHKIHLPDFSYPITEPTKTSFNALIKIVAERQWYMLIRKRQVKNKHLVFSKAEFDENVATLIDAQLEKEKNINLDTLSQLIEQHREIKILVRIFKIDDEADELKRINEWSEKVKDEYIWSQRKILLKEINYTPNFLGKISDSYFKVKGQEVIRKRKEAGIKKIKKVFTNYIFH
jgi:DNA-directed RNA polymerase specialized sigma24 family protein